LGKGKNRMMRKKQRQKYREKESEESNNIKGIVGRRKFIATDFARHFFLYCAFENNRVI
jgi:hypothetical protein